MAAETTSSTLAEPDVESAESSTSTPGRERRPSISLRTQEMPQGEQVPCTATEEAVRLVQAELAAEQLAVTHLDELTARLFTICGLQPLLDEVLAAIIALQQADFGCVQLYNPATQALEMAAHHGFQQQFLEHFRECRDETTVCGRALRSRARVIVEDVWDDPGFSSHRAIADAAGFRAVQSTPLFTRSGEPMGAISTHFRTVHRPHEREIRFTGLYARIATELIERQRTEEALRLSEERFRRYFDMGLIGMAITSVEKSCLEVNSELCRILGYQRDELLRKNWAELTHPDDLADDVLQFERVLAGEIDGYTLDKRWIRKDGRVINSVMAAQCVRRADRSVDYFVGLVLDTTERQCAKEALAESERRYRLLVESIPHHVWSVRRDGTLRYWNQQLADYTGLTADELRLGGRPATHPDDVERSKMAWETAVERGTSYEVEQRIRRYDGEYRHFVCRAAVLKDKQGRPIEWLGTNTDVEERRRAEDELLYLQTELAHVARSATLGEFAASIAHEVNQPLTAVITNGHACIRWLAQETPDLREAAEAAARIVRDAKRASEVILRIREFLKRGTRQIAPTNMNEAISQVIGMVQTQMRNQGVLLRIATRAELPQVAADRIQLQQVILNLVMNALDAMEAIADRARVLQIELHSHDANTLRVAICDSGIGLVPGQRDRAFDAFHTTKPQGMGMGLAISRSIVEAHGGRLWATPNAVHGETFHFTMPIAGP